MRHDYPPESTRDPSEQRPSDERLVRLPEALRTVQLGRSAFLDLVKSGRAPGRVKIGRASFWVASELQAFIAERIRESRGA